MIKLVQVAKIIFGLFVVIIFVFFGTYFFSNVFDLYNSWVFYLSSRFAYSFPILFTTLIALGKLVFYATFLLFSIGLVKYIEYKFFKETTQQKGFEAKKLLFYTGVTICLVALNELFFLLSCGIIVWPGFIRIFLDII